MGNKEQIIKQLINKDINKLKEYIIEVNNHKPFFNKEDYDIVEGNPKYYEPDEYGRTSGAIAIISKYTLSIRIEKHLKYPNPNGWTKIIEDSDIFERCHCIAYRLSARKNDKNNIFIGTDNLNHKIMNKIENCLDKHIRDSKKEDIKILYRVTPIYKSKNQIPIGILMEIEDLDTKEGRCYFCYNIQKNVKFDYSDGSIIEDNRGIIKKYIQKKKKAITQKKQQTAAQDKQTENNNIEFIVNSQTKEYHIGNCEKLNNVEPKYIIEIKTKEKNLIADDTYIACNVCKDNKKE